MLLTFASTLFLRIKTRRASSRRFASTNQPLCIRRRVGLVCVKRPAKIRYPINYARQDGMHLQSRIHGGDNTQDALSCTSLCTDQSLSVVCVCGKRHAKVLYHVVITTLYATDPMPEPICFCCHPNLSWPIYTTSEKYTYYTVISSWSL